MLASVQAATPWGAAGRSVVVEAHVSNGLPGFAVVGLPDAACREARDRVRAALLSSGLVWPLRRITINLAPSGLRKGGAGLDLAIALAVLVADGQLPPDRVEGRMVLAELGLDGSLRPVRGIVALAGVADGADCIVSAADGPAAAAATGGDVAAFTDLASVFETLDGRAPWPEPVRCGQVEEQPYYPDLSDVMGQPLGRLGLEVAAAGGHHLLLLGPPGAGKTMLAQRLPGLLPGMDRCEALEVTRVHSAAGEPLGKGGLLSHRPFRAPHHTATAPALVGGGSATLRPGEISLAHRGVLFLDELGEFRSGVLDALRQPMESGVIRISRAHGSAELPASFLLVAAANPCPCGYLNSVRTCRCSDAAVERYRRRLSGPLRDRFGLQIWMDPPSGAIQLSPEPGEATSVVAERVARARQRSVERCGATVAAMAEEGIEQLVPLDTHSRAVLEDAVATGGLSARGVAGIRRVALTLADLAGRAVTPDDVAVALVLRGVDSERMEVSA